METVKANRHVPIGLGILLVVTLMLGWFAGRFIPGEPRDLRTVPSYRIYPSDSATYIPVSEVEETAFGSSARIEGLKQGAKYTETQPCAITSVERNGERRMFIEELDTRHPDMRDKETAYPSFEIVIEDARAVSFGAFAEWHPDFIERGGAMEEGLVPDLAKIVLVDATVTNLSDDQAFRFDSFLLASDAFNQISPGCLGNGCNMSDTVFNVMSDVPQPQNGEASDYLSLISVASGETRSLTLPYVVSSSYFVDAADFDELDLARFSLEIGDYATGKLYRLALA